VLRPEIDELGRIFGGYRRPLKVVESGESLPRARDISDSAPLAASTTIEEVFVESYLRPGSCSKSVVLAGRSGGLP